jgi:hypothetical protein
LHRGDFLFVFSHLINRKEPFFQICFGVLKDSARENREMINAAFAGEYCTPECRSEAITLIQSVEIPAFIHPFQRVGLGLLRFVAQLLFNGSDNTLRVARGLTR